MYNVLSIYIQSISSTAAKNNVDFNPLHLTSEQVTSILMCSCQLTSPFFGQ